MAELTKVGEIAMEVGILERLEKKAALREPVTFEDLAELHAHIAQIELSYQQLMVMREAALLNCRVGKAAA